MANTYLESIEEARRFVQLHLGDWEAIDRKVLEVVGNAQKITSVPTDSGSLKELNSRIEEQVALRKQMNAVMTEQAVKIQALQSQLAKLSTTSAKNTKSLSDEERQLKALDNSQKKLIDSQSKYARQIESNRQQANQINQATRNTLTTYGAYSQKLIALTREYKNLAIRKAELNNLTGVEAARMDTLSEKITKLRANLVQVDHSVGQFGRSVGSYGKSFDSLGFSIAQITREMPAFAYGAQIGFAALSNNIPMLFDEIKKTRLEVARLKAEGKATASVMSRLGSSIFGLQTLLSIGVTLLTLYGASWIESARGMIDFRSEAEKAKDALEAMNTDIEEFIEKLGDLNKARREGAKSAQDELGKLKLLDSTLKDTAASQEERQNALERVRDLYPEYLKNMTDEELLTNGLGSAYNTLATSILNAAKSRAAFEKIVENSERQLDVESRLTVKKLELVKAQEAYNTALQKAGPYSDVRSKEYQDVLKTQKALELLTTQVKDLTGEQQRLELSNITLTESIEDVTAVVGESKEEGAGRAKSIKEQVIVLEGSLDALRAVKSAMEDERDRLEITSEGYANKTKEIEKIEAQIWRLVQAYEALQEQRMIYDDDFSMEGTAAGAWDENDINSYHQHLRDSADTEVDIEKQKQEMLRALRERGLAHYKYLNDEQIEALEDALRIQFRLERDFARAKEDLVFGTLESIFQARVDEVEEDIKLNRERYDVLLNNEELTAERRAALEAERDSKEAALEEKKLQREKEAFLVSQGIAVAEIALNLARTISAINLAAAAIDAVTFGVGGSVYRAIALPVAIGTAAAQTALVLAQTIPKFAGGTESAPAGLAIVDEIRPEVHTDRFGRVKSYGSEKGSNLRFLEQGDKIYKSREEFFKKVGPQALENTLFALNSQNQGLPISQSTFDGALIREIVALRGDQSKIWREVKKLATRPIVNNIKVEVPDNRPY